MHCVKLTASFLGLFSAALLALAAESSTVKVEKLDPALDSLIDSQVQLEKLATGFKWTEGPVWISSGYKGSASYGGPEPGSNGMTLDSRGRLTVAGHAQRDIWRLESMNPHGQITVLADAYQGKKLNSPNDLVYKSDGSLYFTDPPYGMRTQSDDDPEKELKINGVYRIPNARQQKPGAPPDRAKLQLVIKDLKIGRASCRE